MSSTDTTWNRTLALCFLPALLLLASIPAMGLMAQHPQVLVHENRVIAPLPDWPESWNETLEWPRKFEAWINDRLLGRERALAVSREFLFQWARRAPTDRVLLGENEFMFFKGENADAFDRWFLGRPAVTAEELHRAASEFERRTRWFSAQGISYFMFVVPEKFTIYPEYVPARFSGQGERARLAQVESALSAYPNFISLRKKLLAARTGGDLLYYLTDSHWNGRGALVGYQSIAHTLAAHWPQLLPGSSLVVPPEDDYYVQDLANMVGKPELGLHERAEMKSWYRRMPIDSRQSYQLSATDPSVLQFPTDWAAERWRGQSADLPLKLLVFRDSTSVPLRAALARHFAESLFLSTHRYDTATVLKEKPNVVIEIIVERGVGGLMDGYFHLQDSL